MGGLFNRSKTPPPKVEISRGQRLLLGWIFVAATSFMLIELLGTVWQISRSKSWPATDAKVTVDEIWQSESGWVADLHYTYEVAGRRYSGTRMVINNDGFSTRAELEDLLKPNADGNVPVYYDPLSPDESVLVRGTLAKWTWIIGFLILPIGLVVGIAALRNRIPGWVDPAAEPAAETASSEETHSADNDALPA